MVRFNMLDFRKSVGKNQTEIAEILGCKQPNVSFIESTGKITEEQLQLLLGTFDSEMVYNFVTDNIVSVDKNLIPFYDDVSSVGGSDTVSSVDAVSTPTDYIDAGDWFRDATAAIRHYGESMIEYPTGCILALKEVNDKNLIVYGRDYCIETSEYRVTKRIQKGKDENYFTAYSTNIETYPDGRLIHEPFDIQKSEIKRMYLVLGYVVKKNGGTLILK